VSGHPHPADYPFNVAFEGIVHCPPFETPADKGDRRELLFSWAFLLCKVVIAFIPVREAPDHALPGLFGG
jgi:hypothetical protein